MTYSIEQLKSQISKGRGLARTNLYMVSLPPIRNFSTSELNIICKGVNIPGRGITTSSKNIGQISPNLAVGQEIEPVTLSFHLTNDYLIRKYFEAWQSEMIDTNKYQGPFTVGYHNNYAKDVKITQLRKGESFPVFNADLGFDLNLPPIIRDRLPNVRLPDLLGNIGIGGPDLGDLTQGRLNFALVTSENRVYSCVLDQAIPTAMSPINFTNELDEVGELNVTLTYRNWFNVEEQQRRTIGDFTSDTINTAIGAVIGTFGIGD